MTDIKDSIPSSNTSQVEVFERLLSTSSSTCTKITLLKKIRDECFANVKLFKKQHKKRKRIDKLIDVTNTILSSSSITLIVIGFTVPPILVLSACISGGSFILSRVQDKLDYKSEIVSLHLTITQYNNIGRYINAVLIKNNLSNNEYHSFVCEILERIKLIDESQLF
jgi:hypothetical protein